jgi:hypothetical protein
VYYVWESRVRAPGDVIVPALLPEEVAGALLGARRIEQTLPELELPFEAPASARIGDDGIVKGWRAILHSRRLADVLRLAGVDSIDYHDCRLVNGSTGQVMRTHAIANLLDVIHCLDREASALEIDDEEPNEIWAIERLQLLDERLGDSLMFRLGEQPSIVIVHERIKQAVEAAGLVGPVFLPADGYRDYAYASGEHPAHVLGTHDRDPDGAADADAGE